MSILKILFTISTFMIFSSCRDDSSTIIAHSIETTSLKSEKLNEYPREIDSLCKVELEFRLKRKIKIKHLEVFHSAVLQKEPVYREYIDRENYSIQILAEDSVSNRKESYSLIFNKDLYCYSVGRISPQGFVPIE